MWAITISAYNCQIEYLRGPKNEQADMLSRLQHDEEADVIAPNEVSVINSNRIAAPKNSDIEVEDKAQFYDKDDIVPLPDMAEEQRADPELKKLRKTLESYHQGTNKKKIHIDR